MAYTISRTRTSTSTRTRTSTNPPFAQPINKPIKTTNTAAPVNMKVSKPRPVAKKASTIATTTMPGFSPSKKITPFQRRVYDLLLQIPAGKVSTYAALSKALDSSPRAVGGALRNNPFAPDVPCHRVVASTGVGHSLSRYSATRHQG